MADLQPVRHGDDGRERVGRQATISNYGGTLTVEASSAAGSATVSVKIKGTNPQAADVTTYVQLKHADGFDKILSHKSKMRHSNMSGEPINSFDNGYGMAQLTSPPPSYDEVWNWKLNVDSGIKLFGQKVSTAKTYLSQNGTYTADQLQYEAVCR